MKFYSRHNIDKFIYEEIYNKAPHKNGTFIEVGALDGLHVSNTLFFEKNFDWYGILIEPQKNHYDKLIKNRSAKNYFFNYAINNKEVTEDFIGNFATGGMIKNMEEEFINAWHKGKKTYKVKTIPFYKLITKENISEIDLFSIDVEGSEIEVLNTFDWDIRVNMILLEITAEGQLKNKYKDVDKSKQCRQLLINKNFEFYKRIGNNDLWINKNFKKL